MTINALSYVSWNGNLQSRKIELNWTPPSDGIQENDYVQLVRLHSDQRGRIFFVKSFSRNFFVKSILQEKVQKLCLFQGFF